MANVFYVDGQFAAQDDAAIPVTDLAVLRGYGVFDFMRTYGGKPFHLDAHLERLRRSAELIDLELPLSLDEIKTITLETLVRNRHAESNVRIIITGGATDDFITPKGESRLLVMVTPARPLPAEVYDQGAKIITDPTERYIPGAKTINYIPAIRAMKRARAQDAIEALYVDHHGRALEGTTTNLFAVYGDKLVTPGEGILYGITRQVVLELAEDVHEIEIRDLPLEELLRADEVFITASNKQIVPVIQVDDTTISTDQPGKHTRRMMELFAAYTQALTEA